jgi:hypothetical protein
MATRTKFTPQRYDRAKKWFQDNFEWAERVRRDIQELEKYMSKLDPRLYAPLDPFKPGPKPSKPKPSRKRKPAGRP